MRPFPIRQEVPLLLAGLAFLTWVMPPKTYNGKNKSFERQYFNAEKPVSSRLD